MPPQTEIFIPECKEGPATLNTEGAKVKVKKVKVEQVAQLGPE